LGRKRSNGERDRGESKTGKNIHLVGGQKLLGDAPAVVGNAGVIAQDKLDFPAVNRCAILLHIESGARFDLLASGRKRPCHWKNETDLDSLFGHCVRRGQRKGCYSGQCPPHSFVLQSIPVPNSKARNECPLPNADVESNTSARVSYAIVTAEAAVGPSRSNASTTGRSGAPL